MFPDNDGADFPRGDFLILTSFESSENKIIYINYTILHLK